MMLGRTRCSGWKKRRDFSRALKTRASSASWAARGQISSPYRLCCRISAGDLGRRVAFLLVDRVEQIEGVGEHVPAAHGGIEQPDFLRVW